jgi:hypothetical protein
MRGVAILVTAVAIYSGAHDAARAQTSAPTVITPTPLLSTPVTSTTTNCMMSCNSRAANCQTGCFIPVPPAVTPAGTDLEPDGKHGVRDGLHFEPARVSDHMRERLPVPIGSPLTLRGRRTSLAASGRIIPAPPPKNSRL